jgi:hypothetical protein
MPMCIGKRLKDPVELSIFFDLPCSGLLAAKMLATELLLLLIAVCFATYVTADTGDDISSLVSDLGPYVLQSVWCGLYANLVLCLDCSLSSENYLPRSS